MYKQKFYSHNFYINRVSSLCFSVCLSFLLPTFVLAIPVEKNHQTTVLVTPRRGGIQSSSVGSSVALISREDIENSGKRSVADILRTVPGLEIVQAGDAGRVTSVFLRGAESDQTLVLIDGVRINSGADGAFDFADLRLDNIDRIEIVKGPQSVQYGSEAIGGVISIVTARPGDGYQGAVVLQGGSYSTQDYRVRGSYASADGSFDSSNSISFFNTEGISAAAPRLGNSESDAYENISLSTNNGVALSENWSARAFARYVRGDAELDGFEFGVGPVDDLNFSQIRNLVTGGLRLNGQSESWRSSIEMGTTYENIEGFDPDDVFNQYDITNTLLAPQAHFEYTPVAWSNTHVGYSFEKRASDIADGFDEARNVHSFIFDQRLRVAKDSWFSAGMRHDRYSDFGVEHTFQTTFSSMIPETPVRLHTSFATGFKAPSFAELYFPNFGNPQLQAEESSGYDFGIEYSSGAFFNDLTFFRNEINELITFSSDSFLAENIGSARVYGFEESFKVAVNNWSDVALGYTFTDTENVETGSDLPRRPKHRLSASVAVRPLDRLELQTTLLMVKDRIDSDLQTLDDYDRVDVTARYTGDQFSPFIRLENLFDTRYEEVRGYGTRGLTALAGIELRS